MAKYSITITGITPYMQHRMDDAKLASSNQKAGHIVMPAGYSEADAERALFHSFHDGNGNFYMPAEHIRGALINAGGMLKSKVGNARKSMKNVVAAMFFIKEENIPLPPFDAIDKRSAVNRNIKGRVIVVRPKWSRWAATFTLDVDNDSIPKETVAEIVSSAGSYIGVGSYRPTNNGQFGRFKLEEIKSVK